MQAIFSLRGSFPQFSPIVEKLGKPSRENLQNNIIQWVKLLRSKNRTVC